ncbi:MAG: D-3-phosphoglycerate dehydrogenase [Crocinitomix sp.]|jgi:D-3-phosphoglycerate dehydrogenase
MKKIAFIDIVHPVLQEGLESMNWVCDDLSKDSREEIILKLSDYNGIVIRSRFPMNEDFLVDANKLEFIARSGAGLENIDISYCNGRDIILFNASEGNRNAVAEHALGMILSLFNNLVKGDSEVRDGVWDREGNRGVELDGKIVGIIGYGNNGSAFAKKLRGFDVRVLAYDKYKTGFGNEFVEEVTLSEIQEEANIVSLHVPQTPVTKGMINKRFISQMDNPFYLINLARGTIVNTADLMDGIDSEKVLGACLDVLEYEKSSFERMFEKDEQMPSAFKQILNSKKIILSPHVGGWTVESYRKLSQVLLDQIVKKYSKA